ncbi:MAG: hypothetical protein ACYDBS_06695 [Acidimicrobiales bacterium]
MPSATMNARIKCRIECGVAAFRKKLLVTERRRHLACAVIRIPMS